MRPKSAFAALSLAGALMQAPAAFASVLDYNAAGSGFVGPTVTEDGFDTTAPAGLFITSGGEAAAAFAGDEVTITRVGGGAFSLSSIDFRLFSQSSFSFPSPATGWEAVRSRNRSPA